MKNKELILSLKEKHDSFYLYDESDVKNKVAELKSNFSNAYIIYSIKTNPNKHIVSSILKEGVGSDAASLNEVLLSAKNGLKKEEIYYSAPGKSKNDIENSVEISTIIADSLNEISLINKIAKEKNITANIGIRVNPNFNFFSDEFMPSKFGIDEDLIFSNLNDIKNLSNVNIIGIHIHLRSQELNEDILKTYYKNIFNLAQKFISEYSIPLKFINFGSGIGIDYKEDDTPLNLKMLGDYFNKEAQNFKNKYNDIIFIIESGRFIALKSGVYAMKVCDIKTSGDIKYILLHNTLNGFIRPSMEQLILSYSKDENPFGSEPIFTSKSAFSFTALTDNKKTEKVTLVGNLCTSTDVMKKDIILPKLSIGDVVVVNNAGSYARVLSPMQFSSPGEIPEIFLTTSGEVLY